MSQIPDKNRRAVLKNALTALEQMRSRIDALEGARREPLAIIGMACRFPRAPNPAAFWQLLRSGVDAITEVPAGRWDVDAYFDTEPAKPSKMYTRWGGFLDHVATA